MIEKEYKILLNKQDYEKIVNKFPFEPTFTQVNLYYREKKNNHLDTTIRVRLSKGKTYLQIKEPILKSDGIHIKKEYEKELNIVPYMIDGRTLNELCITDKYQNCFLIGTLVTERRIIRRQECEMAIDINYYCGVIDYELEIKFKEKISPEILYWLKQEKIYPKENTKGKYTRFLEKYYGIENNK